MARARMIASKIAEDIKIANLSDDTSRLAFTWLITFADKEGRVGGDPRLVRARLFPFRDDISVDRMAGYIQEWEAAGLIVCYEVAQQKVIWFPNFKKNQPNLRYEREPDSELPPLPDGALPDDFRQSDGSMPDDFRQSDGLREEKLREEKRREEKISDGGKPPQLPPDSFSAPKTTAQALADPVLAEYKTVAGRLPNTMWYKPVHAALLEVRRTHPEEAERLSYLKGVYETWCNSVTKDGRKYPRDHPAWCIDWATRGGKPDSEELTSEELNRRNGYTKL